MSYWTSREEILLENVESFPQIVEIALTILERMEAEGSEIVEICGPMTTGGLGRERNTELFRHAVREAENRGLAVFDQIPFQAAMIRVSKWTEEGDYKTSILEDFYRPVFESGLVAKLLFLPNWQTSRGACWERDTGIKLGLTVEEYPINWIKPFLKDHLEKYFKV